MPRLKKVFFKFNTPLLSSVTVECILSIAIGGAQVLFCQNKRGRMNDKNFENLLILKCNT